MAVDLYLAPAMKKEPRATSGRETGPSGISRPIFCLLLVAILCLAGLLRFHRLDAQSLWNDEGNSARIAERPLSLIVEGAAGDIHPPGYYLLLHAWRDVFGQSEFALRSLSVVAGLAMVLFTGLLGRWLFGPGVGLMAGFLGSLSPFAVYYSQEARMYALLGALTAASTYVAFRTWDELEGGNRLQPRGRAALPGLLWPVAYALVNAAGLYTHYAFLFVLIAHNACFGLRWLVGRPRSERRWQALLAWLGANLGAVLLYLPWLPTALNARGWSSAAGGSDLGSALLDVARVLAVGVTQSLGEARLAMAGGVGLLAIGLWPSAPRKGRGTHGLATLWGPVSLAVYLLVPLGLFFGLDLYKPAWLKFLVVLLPPYHVLVAHGVRRVAVLVPRAVGLPPSARRIACPVVCGILIAALGVSVIPSLRNLYLDPAYARDDYRKLATDLQAMWRPGDAVVLNAPNQWEVFTYYHPDRDVYPAPYRPQGDQPAAFLDPLVEAYERLFVLYWGDAESDPKKRIESWLARNAYKAGDCWYGDVRLATYAVAPLPGEPKVRLEALFGERMLLQGYTLVAAPYAPGDIVPLTVFWEALDALDHSYKVTVQMLDGEGQLVSQVDTVPDDGLSPTTTWRSGASLVDRYGVSVPRDAPPGPYALILAVYHAASGERLPVVVDGEPRGDYLPMGEVAVRRGGS